MHCYFEYNNGSIGRIVGYGDEEYFELAIRATEARDLFKEDKKYICIETGEIYNKEKFLNYVQKTWKDHTYYGVVFDNTILPQDSSVGDVPTKDLPSSSGDSIGKFRLIDEETQSYVSIDQDWINRSLSELD